MKLLSIIFLLYIMIIGCPETGVREVTGPQGIPGITGDCRVIYNPVYREANKNLASPSELDTIDKYVLDCPDTNDGE